MSDANAPKPGITPTAKTSSPAAKGVAGHPDHAPSVHVKWYVDALVDGHIYHGFIKQISLQGTALFLDLDLGLSKLQTIKLRIHVPPPSRTSPPHLIEVSAQVVFTAYDSDESLYHTGVHFLEFRQESEREYLASHIAAFNKTK